eukprot:TRINITY_DN1953_c0_g1_i1.p1 TRINITY_DN1953_c0_g1~~TRINITY_DN1953_c0_g1_i1.p1  ORF type:complete len:512 (-),score=40.30 TRINITY_DN1953_c0_g1_i1:855-2309(-)
MSLPFYLWLFSMPLVVVVLAHRVSNSKHALVSGEQPSNAEELSDDCRDLFNNLVAACKSLASQKTFSESGWQSCKEAIEDLWFNTSNFTEDKNFWAFETFIEHGREDQVMIPVFWTGFSVSKGTRDVMNEMIPELPGCHGEDFICSDIEHPSSRLGHIMRKGSWYRKCHRSAEDRQLWIRLSEIFAFVRMHDQSRLAAWEDHVRQFKVNANSKRRNKGVELGHKYAWMHAARSALVPILINKKQQDLADSFLFKFELPILANSTSMPKLHLWSLKAKCEDFNKLLPETLRGAECTSLADDSPKPPNSSTGMATVMNLKRKVDCLEESQECCSDIEVTSSWGKNQSSKECFWNAAFNGLVGTVGYLSHAFPHLLEIKDAHGRTPLHYAAGYGHLGVVEFLARADPRRLEIQDITGRTPLHYAAKHGQLGVVEFLAHTYPHLLEIDNGIGKTPLHEAAKHGGLHCTMQLVLVSSVWWKSWHASILV